MTRFGWPARHIRVAAGQDAHVAQLEVLTFSSAGKSAASRSRAGRSVHDRGPVNRTHRSHKERWYDIPDYRGQYQVSNRGRVRGLARIDASGHRRSMKIFRASARRNGRRYLPLCRDGTVRPFCVSVLMAQAYGIPNPRRCRYVMHRNHDNSDFRRGNLAWATLAELRMHDGLRFSCPYYGVTCNQHRGKVLRWTAFFRIEDKRHDLGFFATPEEAAYAYDAAVRHMRLKRPLNGLARPRPYRPERIESLPGEIWRPFPYAERHHVISNKGRVRTLSYVASSGRRILPRLRRIQVDKNGCRTVNIRQKRYGIKTVLARVFGSGFGK